MASTNQVGLESNRIQNQSQIILENLKCSICHNTLWKPVSCGKCKNHFCSMCIRRWLREDRITCPMRCEPFIQTPYSQVISNQLFQLQISCIYAPNRCSEILSYEELEEHEAECGYQPRQCPGCHLSFARKDIEQHESECELIEFTCKYCKIVYKRRDASEKHTDMICLREQFRQHQQQSQTEIRKLKEELEKLRHGHHILTMRLNNVGKIPLVQLPQTTMPRYEYRNPTLEKAMLKDEDRSYLDLRWKELIDDDMQLVAHHAIINNTKHTGLNVGCNLIRDQGIQHIANALPLNGTLTELGFYYNKIGDLGAEYLANALKNNLVRLTSLNLGDNKIGVQGAQHLADALINNNTLTSLEICRNQIQEEGTQYLANALRQNTTLTKLDIGCNRIGERGAQYIAIALTSNATLTTLYLYGNSIGDQGVLHLVNALTNNKTLRELSLSENKIGATGAQHLARTLTNNETLTDLSLGKNQIGDQGIQHLADALRNNQTLTKLEVDSNHIGDQGAQYLADALQQNNTLKNLHLYCNQISSAIKEQLEQQDQRFQ